MALFSNLAVRGTALALLAVGTISPAHSGTYVYVSNADDADVSAYALDRKTGEMTPVERVPAAKLVMPMAASQSGHHLYAVARTRPFSVFSYRVDAGNGHLVSLGTSPLPESMVSVTLDGTGKWLIAASYGANLLSVHRVERDGRIGPDAAQVVSSGGVNPHSVRLDRQNRWLYVPHLGSDEIRIYPFDDNSGQVDVSKGRSVTLPKGTGPRHLVFSPDERFMYVLSELTGKVYAFSRDASTGQLTQFQSESSLPEDTAMVPGQPRAATGTAGGPAFDEAHAIYAADIQITPDGRHLYTSERTQSVLSRFEIEPATGRLRFVEKVPTEAQPRGFAIDSSGRFLVASGQKSSTVSLYAIDPKTGVLQLRQKVVSGKGANWVSIVDTP